MRVGGVIRFRCSTEYASLLRECSMCAATSNTLLWGSFHPFPVFVLVCRDGIICPESGFGNARPVNIPFQVLHAEHMSPYITMEEAVVDMYLCVHPLRQATSHTDMMKLHSEARKGPEMSRSTFAP